MAEKPKPLLNGRELSKGEMEVIRRHFEATNTISGISDEMRELITHSGARRAVCPFVRKGQKRSHATNR